VCGVRLAAAGRAFRVFPGTEVRSRPVSACGPAKAAVVRASPSLALPARSGWCMDAVRTGTATLPEPVPIPPSAGSAGQSQGLPFLQSSARPRCCLCASHELPRVLFPVMVPGKALGMSGRPAQARHWDCSEVLPWDCSKQHVSNSGQKS